MLKAARNDAGLSREHVAFLANVGLRTLVDYESKDQAPPDVIKRLAEIYNRPELKLWHCKTNCELGKHCFPPIEVVDMPAAVLNLLRVLNNETRFINNALMRLSCEHRINETTWQKTQSKLRSIMSAIYSLEIAVEKEKARPNYTDVLCFCAEDA